MNSVYCAQRALELARRKAGIREGDERQLLEQTLNACDVVGIDAGTAIIAGLYKRDYEKSHSVGLADAVIATTAHAHGYSLATLNRKHYPMLKDVRSLPEGLTSCNDFNAESEAAATKRKTTRSQSARSGSSDR